MNLNTSMINNACISIPAFRIEQQKIAQALTDMDSLIENLQSLVKKKQAIKQGAMRQLLTGKTVCLNLQTILMAVKKAQSRPNWV